MFKVFTTLLRSGSIAANGSGVYAAIPKGGCVKPLVMWALAFTVFCFLFCEAGQFFIFHYQAVTSF